MARVLSGALEIYTHPSGIPGSELATMVGSAVSTLVPETRWVVVLWYEFVPVVVWGWHTTQRTKNMKREYRCGQDQSS